MGCRHPRSPPPNSPPHLRILESGKMGDIVGNGGTWGNNEHSRRDVGCGGMWLEKMERWEKMGGK